MRDFLRFISPIVFVAATAAFAEDDAWEWLSKGDELKEAWNTYPIPVTLP